MFSKVLATGIWLPNSSKASFGTDVFDFLGELELLEGIWLAALTAFVF